MQMSKKILCVDNPINMKHRLSNLSFVWQMRATRIPYQRLSAETSDLHNKLGLTRKSGFYFIFASYMLTKVVSTTTKEAKSVARSAIFAILLRRDLNLFLKWRRRSLKILLHLLALSLELSEMFIFSFHRFIKSICFKAKRGAVAIAEEISCLS